MRYVRCRKNHECAVCHEIIYVGEIAIQSEERYYLFYHEDCHLKKFGASLYHAPRNRKEDVK